MVQRILLPLDLSEPRPLPGTLTQALGGTEVVLLGWYEEGPPEEGSDRERRGRAFLYEQAATLLRAGAEVTVEVTRESSLQEVRQAIVDKPDVDAVYLPGPITTFGRLLVALRDERTAANVVALLEGMRLEGLVHVTLFHVADDPAETDAAREMLQGVAEDVAAAGIPSPSVDVEVVVGDDPGFEIGTEAADYDAVLMGETENRSVEEEVFGPIYERVRDRAEEPVILVTRSE